MREVQACSALAVGYMEELPDDRAGVIKLTNADKLPPLLRDLAISGLRLPRRRRLAAQAPTAADA
jgi:hypothetical protein